MHTSVSLLSACSASSARFRWSSNHPPGVLFFISTHCCPTPLSRQSHALPLSFQASPRLHGEATIPREDIASRIEHFDSERFYIYVPQRSAADTLRERKAALFSSRRGAEINYARRPMRLAMNVMDIFAVKRINIVDLIKSEICTKLILLHKRYFTNVIGRSARKCCRF